MRKIIYLLPLLMFVFAKEDAQAEESKPVIPNLKFKDLENKKVMLEDFYSAGPILINFWTLSCEPCKKEMKFLNEFEQKYEEYGFNVISVNMDTPRSISKVNSYIESKNYSFKVIVKIV